MPALVAACAHNPDTLEELLQYADEHGATLQEAVLSGLAVFDEHNTPERCQAIHAALSTLKPSQPPVFRVLDEFTRETSLQPVKAGILIFNLTAKRIVQVMNSWH